MHKIAASQSSKVNRFVRDYLKEFTCTPNTKLYCQLCEVVVRHDKEFLVQSHRKSSKHSVNLERPSTSSSITQKVLSSASNFTLDVTNENPSIRNLFASMGRLCPSESNCRQYISKFAEEERNRVKGILANRKIFLIVDETAIADCKYVNILVGANGSTRQSLSLYM